MIGVGKWIAKHKILILLCSVLLIIPSVFGIITTKINYDLLSYLPDSLETVNGQNIMVEEYGSGGFSMLIVEDMPLKDVEKLEKKVKAVPHVKKTLWYGSVADISIPPELLPEKYTRMFYKENATIIMVLFDNTTSSDDAMQALTEIRKLVNKQVFVSGMTGIVTDIKDLCMQELPIYVSIAAVLSFVVLIFATEYFLIPIFFLLSIGLAILYNLGSNIFLGEISYVTQAVTAVLQLGVTMDYSIFLLNSFEENKKLYPDSKEEAMGHAIASTFQSIVSSSITTVAGFLALCVMTFALGKDLGIVMSKGVVIGVICCVTFLPAIILCFDKQIEKSKHRPLIKPRGNLTKFIMKSYPVWLCVFAVLLIPAIHGNKNVKVYYNIAQSLPDYLDSNVANKELEDTFDMGVMHIVMMDQNLPAKDKKKMFDEIDELEGVKSTIGLNAIVSPETPKELIPEKIKDVLQGEKGDHEIAFVSSAYAAATPEVNQQIAEIQEIVTRYDQTAIVIGEAPMMKDLEDTTNVDLERVNILSIAAIFLIIMIVFKSISLPIILVSVIEFAIFVNMAVPYYQGKELPFVAAIVIGTIQLGATVDYAILMTGRYQRERLAGASKKEAIAIAHQTSIHSVITSGMSFFAATFGVSMFSNVDMIGAICTLLSRGAIISMLVVLTILPAMFMVFDKLICYTTWDFIKRRREKA